MRIFDEYRKEIFSGESRVVSIIELYPYEKKMKFSIEVHSSNSEKIALRSLAEFLLKQKYVYNIVKSNSGMVIESEELDIENEIPKISKYIVMGDAISYTLKNYNNVDEIGKLFVNTLNVLKSGIEDKMNYLLPQIPISLLEKYGYRKTGSFKESSY